MRRDKGGVLLPGIPQGFCPKPPGSTGSPREGTVTYPLGDGDALPQEDTGRPHQPLQHRVSLHLGCLCRVQHVLRVPCAGAWSARAWLPILRVEQASAARGGQAGTPSSSSSSSPAGCHSPAVPWRAAAQGSWCSCPWLGAAPTPQDMPGPGGAGWRRPWGCHRGFEVFMEYLGICRAGAGGWVPRPRA